MFYCRHIREESVLLSLEASIDRAVFILFAIYYHLAFHLKIHTQASGDFVVIFLIRTDILSTLVAVLSP